MNWMKTITTREGLVSRLYWRLLPVLILSCVVISANAFIDSVFAGRFTGFWVLPKDVIRPAYLSDVTGQMENGYDKLREGSYKDWFEQNILWSYFGSDYPWTRLGYTYDWSGGASEYGLTEFLVSDSSRTEIAFTYTTDAFVLWLESQINETT